MHPSLDGLYFIGFFDATGGSNIRMMDDQAEYIAALVTGAVKRRSEADMRRAMLREREWLQTQFPDSPRYGLELDPRRYRRLLSREYARNHVRRA